MAMVLEHLLIEAKSSSMRTWGRRRHNKLAGTWVDMGVVENHWPIIINDPMGRNLNFQTARSNKIYASTTLRGSRVEKSGDRRRVPP